MLDFILGIVTTLMVEIILLVIYTHKHYGGK
jgi:hypothetical protein